jgi:Zn finger protein HypA/HybF involved in hydrogenase expression
MSKIKVKKFKLIIPLRKICVNCKKAKVTDHHFLCNKCYSQKDKLKNKKKNHTNQMKRWAK